MAREIDIIIFLEKGRTFQDGLDYPLSQEEQGKVKRAIRRIKYGGDENVTFRILPERRLEEGSQPEILVEGETLDYSSLRIAEDN